MLKLILGIATAFFALAAVANQWEQHHSTSRHVPYGPYERYLKRPLDVVLSAVALIVLSPALLVTAVLVRVKLGSPVIFKQERPGKDEKIFTLYKFRTMTDARDENGDLLPDAIRLTGFGKKLRATSLDELPELWNILRGDMSIIGPRPLLVRYLSAYTDEEKQRHDIRPGLSGLAQVSGRNFLPWSDRLALDVKYVRKITFIGDFKIVLITILQAFRSENVAPDTDESGEGYLDEVRDEERNLHNAKNL